MTYYHLIDNAAELSYCASPSTCAAPAAQHYQRDGSALHPTALSRSSASLPSPSSSIPTSVITHVDDTASHRTFEHGGYYIFTERIRRSDLALGDKVFDNNSKQVWTVSKTRAGQLGLVTPTAPDFFLGFDGPYGAIPSYRIVRAVPIQDKLSPHPSPSV